MSVLHGAARHPSRMKPIKASSRRGTGFARPQAASPVRGGAGRGQSLRSAFGFWPRAPATDASGASSSQHHRSHPLPRAITAKMQPKTRIGITMGDPAGIGPEIVIKAVSALITEDERWAQQLQLYGESAAFEKAGKGLGMAAGKFSILGIPLIQSRESRDDIPTGRLSAEAGEAAFQALRSSLDDIKHGRIGGIVTAPLSKAALNLAGHHYPGHTEILSAAAGNVPVRMMLANPELAVVLVTIHQPLKQALEAITAEKIEETIVITDAHYRRFHRRKPVLAVAGLNPHAGEGGLLGREELDIIQPAIDRSRARGLEVSGPFPPDTIFMQARQTQRFDAVIAQYHDQGLIPIKYLGVENGVNITLGLPFVRTSPDHGTAFDIAGKGLADASSLVAAIRKADALLRGAQ